MSTSDEKAAEKAKDDKQRAADKRQRLADKAKSLKDILWASAIASVVTIVIFTSTGWLTTQKVVEDAREDGQTELMALRASICLVKFEQRDDAAAKRAEFEALPWSDKETVAEKFVAAEGLATMRGQDNPAEGAVAKCANAILRS
ncbi:MAG: hypothetical protein HOH66_03855 [Rhodospirillaceae bacterium]|jgi:hypothetical protein|nr:hypothetical protein [Rhodospirillaceae bacterium]MBT6116977.1 hypothetical protein [Rhodospirillaceae bacterium]